MLTQQIPDFNERFVQGECADKIRPDFIPRMRPDLTKQEKEALQDEFSKMTMEAFNKAKKENKKKVAEISKLNTQAFIDHPKKVIEELKDDTFTVAEKMRMRHIGKSTIVRKGKGVLIGKGSSYPQTISTFLVTIIIGKTKYEYTLNSGNEAYSKNQIVNIAYANMIASVLANQQ